MNPILHNLQNKQWIWTAAHAKKKAPNKKLSTGFSDLDKVLYGGFPQTGMIHLQSPLGCGEMRLMLSMLHQHKSDTQQLYVFINPPFELNAEFLIAHNIALEQLVVVKVKQTDEALWSAEQCAKSGACYCVFLWQEKLKHIHVRKLEYAAQKGACYCVWMHNHSNADTSTHANTGHTVLTKAPTNLPLSLSLSVERQNETLSITINKQKVGWAQKAVKIPLPFRGHTNALFNQKYKKLNFHNKPQVTSIHAKR